MSRFANLADTAPDAAFALIEQFKADPSSIKVDLSPGFYRDEDAKPWVLPSVRMVSHKLSLPGPTLVHFVLTTARPSKPCSTTHRMTMSTCLCSDIPSSYTKLGNWSSMRHPRKPGPLLPSRLSQALGQTTLVPCSWQKLAVLRLSGSRISRGSTTRRYGTLLTVASSVRITHTSMRSHSLSTSRLSYKLCDQRPSKAMWSFYMAVHTTRPG